MTIPTDVLNLGLLLIVLLALSVGFAAGAMFEGCRRGGSLDLTDRVQQLERQLRRRPPAPTAPRPATEVRPHFDHWHAGFFDVGPVYPASLHPATRPAR